LDTIVASDIIVAFVALLTFIAHDVAQRKPLEF
jgi:hypothetical protein